MGDAQAAHLAPLGRPRRVFDNKHGLAVLRVTEADDVKLAPVLVPHRVADLDLHPVGVQHLRRGALDALAGLKAGEEPILANKVHACVADTHGNDNVAISTTIDVGVPDHHGIPRVLEARPHVEDAPLLLTQHALARVRRLGHRGAHGARLILVPRVEFLCHLYPSFQNPQAWPAGT